MKIFGKIILATLVIFLLFMVGLTVYLLYIQQDGSIYKILLPLGIITILVLAFLYPIYRISIRKYTKEDMGIEKQVLEDVTDIKSGRYLGAKSFVGKLYLGAFIFIIIFPFLVNFSYCSIRS